MKVAAKGNPLEHGKYKVEITIRTDGFGKLSFDVEDSISEKADIVIIGTDEAENWIGYAAYRDARKRQFESFENVEFNVYDQRITLAASGDVAWFSQKFDLLVIAQGTPVSLEGIRLTGVLEKRRGYWQIVQLHNSVPVLGQAAEY